MSASSSGPVRGKTGGPIPTGPSSSHSSRPNFNNQSSISNNRPNFNSHGMMGGGIPTGPRGASQIPPRKKPEPQMARDPSAMEVLGLAPPSRPPPLPTFPMPPPQQPHANIRPPPPPSGGPSHGSSSGVSAISFPMKFNWLTIRFRAMAPRGRRGRGTRRVPQTLSFGSTSRPTDWESAGVRTVPNRHRSLLRGVTHLILFSIHGLRADRIWHCARRLRSESGKALRCRFSFAFSNGNVSAASRGCF